MDSLLQFLVIFFVGSALLIALALIINTRVRARIRAGKVEFIIDTPRPGWHRAPRQPPIKRRQRPSGRAKRPYHTWLVAKVRNGPNWEYSLDGRQQVYIGRRSDNDIALRDPAADTRHAVIYWHEGRYRINNLSPRGTRVNNHLITMQNLGNGNKIRMGRTELIFRQTKGDKRR